MFIFFVLLYNCLYLCFFFGYLLVIDVSENRFMLGTTYRSLQDQVKNEEQKKWKVKKFSIFPIGDVIFSSFGHTLLIMGILSVTAVQ